ncbi:unnamed protein product [Camellia sinensis]
MPKFETDYVVECTLSMNEDLLNRKYKDKLEPSYKIDYSLCLSTDSVDQFHLQWVISLIFTGWISLAITFLEPSLSLMGAHLVWISWLKQSTCLSDQTQNGIVYKQDGLSNGIAQSMQPKIIHISHEDRIKTIWYSGQCKVKMEMNKIRDELNEKISEVRRLQIELTRRENAETNDIADGLKRVIATLEKENNNLK